MDFELEVNYRLRGDQVAAIADLTRGIQDVSLIFALSNLLHG